MYEEVIRSIPDERWRTGNIDYLILARLVYPVLETVDFYSSEKPDGFPWGQRFNADPWDALPEKLPSKDEALEYHGDVMNKIRTWLS